MPLIGIWLSAFYPCDSRNARFKLRWTNDLQAHHRVPHGTRGLKHPAMVWPAMAPGDRVRHGTRGLKQKQVAVSIRDCTIASRTGRASRNMLTFRTTSSGRASRPARDARIETPVIAKDDCPFRSRPAADTRVLTRVDCVVTERSSASSTRFESFDLQIQASRRGDLIHWLGSAQESKGRRWTTSNET